MSKTKVKKMINKASTYLLLGVMLFVSMAITMPVSAENIAISYNQPIVTEGYKKVAIPINGSGNMSGTPDALKAAISVKRTGDSDYSPLTTNDTVNFNLNSLNSELVVSFENELIGDANEIKIAAGALMFGGNTNIEAIISPIIGRDITPPAYVGSRSGVEGRYVYLKFDESVYINNGTEDKKAYIRSKISVTTDGVNYSPLLELDSGYEDGQELYIRYSNNMSIILSTNTKIKIASGTLKDAAGNLNAEMILDVTLPVIQSAEISNNNHDVTITFNEDIFDNTDGDLSDYIYLLRNGPDSDWVKFTDGDTVSIDSIDPKKLVIHYSQALSGANNQIIIVNKALKDNDGNVHGDYIATPYIAADAGVIDPNPVDKTPPKLVDNYFTNGSQDIILVFDENVLNNHADEAAFKKSVTINDPSCWGCNLSNTRYNPIDNPTTVTFLENMITIHFPAPMTGNQYYVQFPGNSVRDASGNVGVNTFYSDYMYPKQTILLNYGSFSNNGRWLNLQFNVNIADNTLIGGVSNLKEKISISTDQGTTYSKLGEQDVLFFQDDHLVVLFHEPKKSGTVRVKIEAEALMEEHNNARNGAIDKVIAYNTPDVKGYFFSDTESEFLFEDNDVWRSKVTDIIVYDDYNEVSRVLNSSEYTLTAGKLTVKQGVFLKDEYYGIAINADGYSSTKWIDGKAFKSSEVFYMTAPVQTTENGITASINVLNPEYYYYYYNYFYASTGNQTVVFELMNGTTPVSIVSTKSRLNTGTYTANFNVKDAATNPNYTVRAFIVNTFNHDFSNAGINLATEVAQTELDQKQVQLEVNLNTYYY